MAKVLLENHRAKIKQWLLEDEASPKKQRHTARRIYTRLADEEGLLGSEVNVRRYVRLTKASMGKASSGVFLVLDPDCGKEAEADWGRGVAIIQGIKSFSRIIAVEVICQ